MQSASVAFTPTFQATIRDVLTDEKDYTRTLSFSRSAYDLESLVGPMLAAALLTVISFHDLFVGTAMGFIASAALVVSVTLPASKSIERRGIYVRTTRGLRIILATPRLRGLPAVNFAVAAASSMVIVNAAVLVQARYGLDQRATAIALAVFGAGSMVAALVLPRLLENLADRTAILGGGALLCAGLLAGALVSGYSMLLPLWFALGVGYSLAQTPTGRLSRRSALAEDRPALFAAQFALSHLCWLVTYPVAGWVGARVALPSTFLLLGLMASAAVLVAIRLWPAVDTDTIAHEHTHLDPSHPHTADAAETATGGRRHTHLFLIDSNHTEWPTSG
jgi:predicted MFS family arabinose efflux permease